MERLLQHRLTERFIEAQTDGSFEQAVERVVEREISPATAIDELLQNAV